MKRLEYSRRVRTTPGHARNAAGALLQRLQVTFERQRLEQERIALVRRVQRIEARLLAIGAAPVTGSPPVVLPRGTSDVTLQY
jgi:hypothetical protein